MDRQRRNSVDNSDRRDDRLGAPRNDRRGNRFDDRSDDRRDYKRDDRREDRRSDRRSDRLDDRSDRSRRSSSQEIDHYSPDHSQKRRRERGRDLSERQQRSLENDKSPDRYRRSPRSQYQRSRSDRTDGANRANISSDGWLENDRKRERDWFRRESIGANGKTEPETVEKPNYGLSGVLAKESNSLKGIALKFHEPPNAALPPSDAVADSAEAQSAWRLYVFRGDKQVDLIKLVGRSCFLLGRDEQVCDIPLTDGSCSKQHAVIQFRQVVAKDRTDNVVKPYVIDLDSTNGTELNKEPIEESRFIELRSKDMLQFADDKREFILLRE